MTTNQPTTSLPSHASHVQNARRSSLLFLAANVISTLTYLFITLIWQVKTWQLWGLVAISLLLTIAGMMAVRLSRQGRPEYSMYLLIGATIFGGLAGSALVAGLGVLLASIIILVSLVLAAQALSRHLINRILIFSGLAGLSAVALNVVSEPIQAKIPALQNTVPVLAVLAIIAFGWVVIRQFNTYPISTKLLALFLAVVLLAVSAVATTATWMLKHSTDARTIEHTILFVSLTIILVAGAFSSLAAQFLTRPIRNLTNISSQIAAGDLHVRASIETDDEIGELASTFNSMTSRLEESLTELEQRVEARTRDLAAVAEIGTATATILETGRLLQEVVDVTKERFSLYHSHIYLLDEAGKNLVLTAGSGNPGRVMTAEGHSILLDNERSIVARAARERKGITVNDVTQTPDFLPNALLPDTHSELAVPMIIGEQVIGVFDVQSEVVGRFTDADIAIQTTLASQIASAVQNARSYTKVQRSQVLLSEALNIAKLANWEYDVNRDRFIFNDHFYTIFRTTVEQEGGYELSSAEYAERLVYPEDLPLVGAEIEKALKSTDRHYSTKLEHRILYRDGSGIGYMSVEVHIERDNQGRILRYYGANQDITERKSLEELNRKRAAQQEAINTITQKIQSANTIEEAMQVAARELGHAFGNRQTLVALESSAWGGNGKANSAK